MALTNTSLPNHLSIYSPPDFVSGPHLDEKKGALADPSPVVTEIREKPSFESSLRTAANSKHRQSTLSTTSTRLGRGSFLNFAALARDKTNDAIASLSGPVLRSRTSGTFTNEQINTTISGRPRESYIGQRRSVLPSPKSSAQNLRESVQPIASQHGREQSAYTLPAIDIDTPHHDMHQTSSRLLRMTDDERPFTKVSPTPIAPIHMTVLEC